MFWVCEINNKDDRTFCKEDYESLLDVLKHLFIEMMKCSEAGFMPYYFIPKINVIESIPVATQNKAIHKIQAILQNIEYHLPLISEIAQYSSEMIGITKSLLKLAIALSHQNWIPIFHRNPNIASKNIDRFINYVLLKEPVDDTQKVTNGYREGQQKLDQYIHLFKESFHYSKEKLELAT